MSQPERLGILSQLQLRIAAIYAVQNEDVQRQRRQELQDKRHREIEEGKRNGTTQRKRPRRQTDIAQQPQTPMQSLGETQQMQAQAAQAQAQAMIQQSSLYLPQPSPQQNQIPPVQGMAMPSFQHYPGPPKRMRGRPSQASTQGQVN